jgi:SNF2 family DNA or RNA helicase
VPSRALSSGAFPTEDFEELPSVDELQEAKKIFDSLGPQYKELMFTKWSNKARVVIDIVTEAMTLKENILIFVHSIPTLEYLEKKLIHKKFHVFVLTGSTPVKERQASVDRFNRTRCAIYLISCKVYKFFKWSDKRRGVWG